MKLFREKTLLNKITFIDGLPGTGKSLIAPLLSSLKENDLWLLNHNYEYLIYLHSIKKISLDATKILLNIWADKDLNDLLLGRNVNFRSYDDSSVQKNLYLQEVKKRFLIKKLPNKIAKKNLLIMSHNLFFLRKKLSKIFPKYNFICILRNPVHIITAFDIRSWQKRYVNDPKELSITYIQGNKVYPWFLKPIKAYNFTELFINFVCDYTDSVINEKKIKKIYFEKFISDPNEELKKCQINDFEKSKNKIKLMKRLNLPRKNNISVNQKQIEVVINQINSNNLRKKFLRTLQNYNNKTSS